MIPLRHQSYSEARADILGGRRCVCARAGWIDPLRPRFAAGEKCLVEFGGLFVVLVVTAVDHAGEVRQAAMGDITVEPHRSRTWSVPGTGWYQPPAGRTFDTLDAAVATLGKTIRGNK